MLFFGKEESTGTIVFTESFRKIFDSVRMNKIHQDREAKAVRFVDEGF